MRPPSLLLAATFFLVHRVLADNVTTGNQNETWTIDTSNAPTIDTSNRSTYSNSSTASPKVHSFKLLAVAANDEQLCSTSNPCKQGCCNMNGYCGFGPQYCNTTNCVDTCDAQAECGPYAPVNQTECPLNVCCSKYGFCGTTELFCGDGCTNGCDSVNRPSCGGSSATERYMGYYESWSPQRPCDSFTPSQLDPEKYTHLYYSFALIGGDGSLTTMNSYDPQYYKEFTGLKSRNPGLKTIISVGGWDAGGQVFSGLAASASKTETFVNSAISFMKQYGFDGIDVDWEYPVAPDRGGNPADKENFVTLLEKLKNACGSTYTVTITIPSSYWYMRGFDIVNLEKHIDWFNFMSYDIHGTWDGDNPYTQRVVNPHTNLTEISDGLDLLWRNKIDPSKVALGLGFYGRSFTLSDPSCNTPGCSFAGNGGGSGGGNPGECTQVSGTLSDFEIERIMSTKNPQFTYNQEAGVNWITWDSDQWVSFDDNNTLAQKEQYASNLCLSGQFAWAVDLGGPGSGQSSGGTGTGSNSTNSTNGSAGNETGSGDVYISPEIWNEPNPTIACYPPCTFILPPYPLSSQSIISFPLYTTSLEVAWPTTSVVTRSDGKTSTVSTVGRTTETTTLTIPAVTESTIDVWNWVVNNTAVSTTTYQATSSILPPPFVITDDPNPESSPGVTHPVQTRNITAPPYPYSNPYASTTSDSPSKTSSTTAAAVIFPSIHFTRGPPGPTCLSGCGHKCKIFCNTPCLFCGGIDGGLGFNDPNDPDPPPPPPPGPPPGTTGETGGDTEDEGDQCDPELDDTQGLCDNGGFPLYNPGTGNIDCDNSPAEAQGRLSACQLRAMNDPSATQDMINEAKTCCDGTTAKRSVWGRLAEIFRRSGTGSACKSKTPLKGKAVPAPTYTCDGRFPNICANAKSAIENYPARNWDTMTRRTGGSHSTNPIWLNKLGSKVPDNQKNAAVVGWDLEGCNVEEYPFSSGRLSGVQPVLRLVPSKENDDHAEDYGDFLNKWDMNAGTDDVNDPSRSDADKLTAGVMENTGKPFYIRFTPDIPDQSTEWGLTNNAAGNICGNPYGSDFLLTGGPVKSSMQWDPYFERAGRLRTYSRFFPNKPDPVIQTYPPQYCKVPSPGRMAYVNGGFKLSRADGTVIGKAAPAPDPMNIGFCEPWPPATAPKLKAREDEEILSVALNTTTLQPQQDTLQRGSLAHPRHAPALRIREGHLVLSNTSSGVPKTSPNPIRELAVRQASSGSYLDPNVYAFLGCSNDDYDPCDWDQVCGQGDGSIGAADDPSNDPSNSGGSTTTPPVTSKPSPTTKPPASTTFSSSSNCKDCIGVVGTPVSCSFVNGCTPTTPTSSPPPPPPPPPPPSTPPAPKQTSSNSKGSGLCASLGDGSAKDNEGHNMCQIAYSRYLDDHLYTGYTSYTYTANDAFNTALGVFFRGLRGLVGQEGCTAYFKCNSDDAYKEGMTGRQIKSAFDNLFANDKVKVCGSSYLDNGCHVTVNGCNNCADVGVVCSTKAGNCSPDEVANSPSENDTSKRDL